MLCSALECRGVWSEYGVRQCAPLAAPERRPNLRRDSNGSTAGSVVQPSVAERHASSSARPATRVPFWPHCPRMSRARPPPAVASVSSSSRHPGPGSTVKPALDEPRSEASRPHRKGTQMNDMVPVPASGARGSRPGQRVRQDANAVVFVHGLWLLDSSWDRWAAFFEEAGYGGDTRLADDPTSVEEAREHPERVRRQERRRHRRLPAGDRREARQEAGDHRPLVRWAAGADPRRARTVGRDRRDRPGPVARRPAAADRRAQGPARPSCRTRPTGTRRSPDVRPVPVRVRQRGERGGGRELYEKFHVAGSGVPIFQAAFANINPNSETKVEEEGRGPRPDADHRRRAGPPGAARRWPWRRYKKQSKNKHHVTEFTEIAGRGHSLTIDNGWEQVAQTCLDFVIRFVK